MRKIMATVVLVALVTCGTVFAIHRNKTITPVDSTKVQVTASFYPLYDVARTVGGEYVQVTNMTPAGSEPHDYEPSPQALVQAQNARLFVYNGGTLEPWAAKFVAGYAHTLVKASDGILLRTAADESGQSAQDPHFWLDPVLMQQVVINVRDGLVRADPAHGGVYRHNAELYIAQLKKLDSDFSAGLATCQTRTLITSHQAFGYLAQRYNLDVVSIAGISPDDEPSAAKLAEITNVVRAKGIHYVFFESLVSPRLADTIASETGAKTLVFDPIEGMSAANQDQGKNYITVQYENLQNIRTALACN